MLSDSFGIIQHSIRQAQNLVVRGIHQSSIKFMLLQPTFCGVLTPRRIAAWFRELDAKSIPL